MNFIPGIYQKSPTNEFITVATIHGKRKIGIQDRKRKRRNSGSENVVDIGSGYREGGNYFDVLVALRMAISENAGL